ncbi:MAG: M20/M25/M40 family metallo-hydrolase [Clostridia bacterium]|nr:M20/M25/M40 family metallo-hydrolase [Clostridia bacterium]
MSVTNKTNLSKGIEQKETYAQYMIDEITHVIKTCGKRDPGSEGEKKSCEYMGEVLKDLGCEDVKLESYTVAPRAFYGWIYFTMTFVLLAIAAFFFMPVVSIPLIAAGFALVLIQFGFYKKLLDPLFKKKTSHNVTAIKKCSGETKRRIIFNGHPDATWEWPVNYALGGVGFEGHAIIAIGGAIYFLVLSVIAVVKFGFGPHLPALSDPVIIAGLVGLIFVPFMIGLYFMVNYKRVVDGANDNLTGCYMGIAVLKYLKDEGIELENTEVGVILTGSEEIGLRGSKAWAEAHKGEFRDVPTFIYAFDTINESKYLMSNYRDLNGTVKCDKDVADLFYEAAQEAGVPCKKGWVPPLGGAVDAAGFTQGGFRAAGVTGLNHKLERYYHTRLDSYDNMNKEGIANCFAATVKTLEMFDNGAKQ